MSHLSSERLAALSDDTPSPIEASHLTTCRACSAELAAHRKLARLAAAAQVMPGAPVSSFDTLAPRLRAEGLIAARDHGTWVRAWVARAAAALVLLAGGVALGRSTAKRGLPELPGVQATDAKVPAGTVQQPPTPFNSSAEALNALAAAQQAYQTAAAFLAAQDTSAHFIGLNQNTYRTRLEALDQITAATRAALYRAPQDPVLNQYYLGTLTEREATLTQLKQAMPSRNKFRSY